MLPAVLQLKAVALAAQKFKEFNGFWNDDGFEPSAQVHVGVAISLRGGAWWPRRSTTSTRRSSTS